MNGPALPVKPTPPTPPQMNFTGHTLKDGGETQPAAASVGYNASPAKTDGPKTEKDVEKLLSTPQLNVVNGNQAMQNQAAAANNSGNAQLVGAANAGQVGQAAPEQVLPGKMTADGRQNIWPEDAAPTTEAQVVAPPAHSNILDRPVSSGWSFFFLSLFLLAGVAAVFIWRNQSGGVTAKAKDTAQRRARAPGDLAQAKTVEVVDLLTRPVDIETETPLSAAPLMTKQSSSAEHPNFEVRI